MGDGDPQRRHQLEQVYHPVVGQVLLPLVGVRRELELHPDVKDRQEVDMVDGIQFDGSGKVVQIGIGDLAMANRKNEEKLGIVIKIQLLAGRQFFDVHLFGLKMDLPFLENELTKVLT